MQNLTIKTTALNFRTRESYKTLRSNVEFSGDHVRTISITSCTPNEGKSSVSFQLARSFAESGNKVILIDADMRKSVMQTHFTDGKIQYGLTNYLVGKCSLEDAIAATNEDGFQIILSGPSTPSPSELLNSERFEQLLKYCRENYDYIIIDTPPLGSVIDSAIIGRQCDGVLIVISSGTISRRFAQDVIGQLKMAGCRILGCVLNKVEMSSHGGYYGKYYGRYYGKYYGKYYANYDSESKGDESAV